MTRETGKAAIVVMLLTIVAPCAHAECAGSSLNSAEVQRLIDAATVQQIEAAWRGLNHGDAALSAVYHQRRLEISPTPAEELRWLKALPRTEADLNRIYELTFTRDVCETTTVAATVYGMFDTAARLVQKYGILHRRLLSLCLYSNAAVGEVAFPACDTLLQKDPVLTVAALRKLPRALRIRYCGSDPRHLSVPVAVARCQSGL